MLVAPPDQLRRVVLACEEARARRGGRMARRIREDLPCARALALALQDLGEARERVELQDRNADREHGVHAGGERRARGVEVAAPERETGEVELRRSDQGPVVRGERGIERSPRMALRRGEVAERALAWPVRSGRLVLKIALERVAEYYRIT